MNTVGVAPPFIYEKLLVSTGLGSDLLKITVTFVVCGPACVTIGRHVVSWQGKIAKLFRTEAATPECVVFFLENIDTEKMRTHERMPFPQNAAPLKSTQQQAIS